MLPFFIKSLRISEHLRATYVNLFVYEKQVDLSNNKKNTWNIAINEKKKHIY